MHEWLGWTALGCAGIAAALLIQHLWRRPALTPDTRLRLLFGLGVFPILSAGAANIKGFQSMESRKFCGSCHVMIPQATDSRNHQSHSLSSIHARNKFFGEDNCYSCHADYGMYGFVVTKMGGMRHVYYYLTKFRSVPVDEAKREIRINKPLPNGNCMECHTTTAPDWLEIGDHASAVEGVRNGSISCASPGCHGYAHPNTKTAAELELARPVGDAGL